MIQENFTDLPGEVNEWKNDEYENSPERQRRSVLQAAGRRNHAATERVLKSVTNHLLCIYGVEHAMKLANLRRKSKCATN